TNKVVVEFGQVNRSYLKKFDIKQPVFCANFNWDNVIDLLKVNKIKYSKLPKYPSVRRDLALLVDKSVQYSELEKMAFQTEKKLLKSVNLFDVYEGENIEKSKKSYAIAFTFQDEEKTLTDKHVDGIMQRLISAYTEKIKAVIR
ncbi:phenylalanine--tRNA ligase subunit beta, partial [Bacteroidales bacterium AH-315-I05]|nr:phenylalanine--tRNA ligase subunit beta [Bacteroidales bacterium AH-315-I05]